jgi:hypothetical protein
VFHPPQPAKVGQPASVPRNRNKGKGRKTSDNDDEWKFKAPQPASNTRPKLQVTSARLQSGGNRFSNLQEEQADDDE